MSRNRLASGGDAGRKWDQALFAPREVVVFGASSNRQRLSSQILARLEDHGYAGAVHLVNPRGGLIDGQPVHRSAAELHPGIDLALVLVPSTAVAPVLTECAAMRVRAAVVFTADVDRQVIHDARGSIRVLGPNSQGLYSADLGLAATFSHAGRQLTRSSGIGSTAVVSQSGAVAGVLWDSMRTAGIDVAYWVTTGNEADLDVVDIGRQLGRADGVERVVFYVEGLRRGPAFLDMLAELRRSGKQAMILCAGRSDLGRAAATTHTASTAGDFEVMRRLCEAAGAVVLLRVEDIVNLLQVGALQLRSAPSTLHAGVTIVSSSGGFGTMLVDELHDAGLPVAQLSADTSGVLSRALPAGGSPINPVDLTAGFLEGLADGSAAKSTLWTTACRLVADDRATTAIALVVTMVTGAVAIGLTKEIRRLSDDLEVPVCVAWLGGDLTEQYRRLLRADGVPVYATLSGLVSAVRWLSRHDDPVLCAPGATHERVDNLVDEAAALQMLADHGILTPHWAIAGSGDDAVRLAKEYGGRAVLKGLMSGVLHKTDVGLVTVCDEANVRSAFDQLSHRLRDMGNAAPRITVQEFVEHDDEILVGLKRDPVFGTVLVLGGGGILAGADTSVRIVRLDDDFSAPVEIARAVAERTLPDLTETARTELADTIARLSRLMADHSEFQELEINPVGTSRKTPGAIALDIVVRTK